MCLPPPSCRDFDLESRPGTAMYKSGPRHHKWFSKPSTFQVPEAMYVRPSRVSVIVISRTLDGRLQIESAALSRSGGHLAVSVETKSWLGLKTRQAGFLYAIRNRAVVGRIVLGKREAEGWALEKVM